MPAMFHRVARFLTRAVWRPLPVDDRLHVCVRCRRDFCWPVDWESVDESHWRIAVRCGECGHEREVVAPDGQAAVFDLALDRHEDAIARAADRLSLERMQLEVEAFAAALAADLIDADYFGPR
jgi:DNA-directed RNA polymerase subunit RPC12/RpoP